MFPTQYRTASLITSLLVLARPKVTVTRSVLTPTIFRGKKALDLGVINQENMSVSNCCQKFF